MGMTRPWIGCLLALALVASCGDSTTNDAIDRICTAMAQCGAIAGSDTGTCTATLSTATSATATRAVAECADCVDKMSCGQVEGGGCATTCRPLFDTVNSTAGKVSGLCTASSAQQFADKTTRGELAVFGDCSDGPFEVDLGPFGAAIGTSHPCGAFSGAYVCSSSTGTAKIEQDAGGVWVTGTCTCVPDQGAPGLTFRVPLRLSL
jgi:hypothetical protein